MRYSPEAFNNEDDKNIRELASKISYVEKGSNYDNDIIILQIKLKEMGHIVEEYENKFAADKAYARLRSYGHKLLLYPLDSVRFKIAIPFMTPLSDTTRTKDSLKIFFGGKPYVEIN